MPLIIGYANDQEIQYLKSQYETFVLDENESRGLGISPIDSDDILVACYIPMSVYDKMDSEKWDNTYIIDERDSEEQVKLGL